MRIAGVLPEDAPDPRLEQAARLKAMPIPVQGFVAQPALEDDDSLGMTIEGGGRTPSAMSVSVGYLLWRNPADRSDPVNLAVLDERTRRSIESVPPWPRPAWLIERVEARRYPHLWEAVRTSWHAAESERTSPGAVLVDHVTHVIMNQFREEAGIELHGWDSPALPTARSIRAGIAVHVDGKALDGMEIDTDPFVYAVGAALPTGGVLTAVVPRDDLPLIELAFATRPHHTASATGH